MAVALITGTGAPRGIGMACARALGRAGFDLAITATSGRIEARRAELMAEGFNVLAFQGDLTDPASVARLFDATGPAEVLVNNAGIHRRAPFETMSLSDWQTVMDTNLTSAFIVSQAVSRYMRSSAAKERSSISLRLMRKRPGRPLPIIAPLRAA